MFHVKHFDKEGRQVIRGEGAIDWLTLTTFDGGLYDALNEALISKYGSSDVQCKIQGYVGIVYDGVIKVLVGRQQRQEHFMMQVSGYEADELFRYMRSNPKVNAHDWKCTRIDIQVTEKSKRGRKRLSKIGLDLQSEKHGVLKNRRNISIRYIGSSTGDTVYIGKPKSEKMTRLYDKELIDEKGKRVKCDRFEIQLKGDTANKMYQRCVSTSLDMLSFCIGTIVKGEFEQLPEPIQKQIALYQWKADMVGELITRAASEKKSSNRFNWMRKMSKAIVATCNEPFPIGYMAQEFLLAIVIGSLSGNPIENPEGWHLVDDGGNLYNAAHLDYNLISSGKSTN